MKNIKPPSNKKKRLYKMIKHLGNPQERWWQIDASLCTESDWQAVFGGLDIPPTGWSEVEMRQWVDTLHAIGFDAQKRYWLGVYRDLYLPLVERVMQQAREGGFGLKTLSSVYVGSRNFPVWTDCWVSPSGLVVFTESRAMDAVGARRPAVLRSAFRPAPSVDIPPWMMARYYASRSEHYAEKFGLSLSQSLSEAGEGWRCGDLTEGVDVASLQAVLASGGEVLGRGLMDFCVYDVGKRRV